MPKVKSTTTEEKQAPKSEKAAVCGHVNRHSYGVDRKLDNMKCDLVDGHAGDHSGLHDELQRAERIEIRDGIEVVRVIYESVEVRAYWGDMAGTPADQIKQPDEEELSMMELDRRIRDLERKGIDVSGNRKVSVNLG